MMAKDEYIITELFEEKVAEYTGSPYAIAVDNCSNALFLCLMYVGIKGKTIHIPSCTYMSVPCAVINAGGIVDFTDRPFQGIYYLSPTKVIDAALRFTWDMYIEKSFMCLSFTGPYKHLKLGKGGMILTDNKDAYEWFKKARNSGRNECSYMDDDFQMTGWNFYMPPETAARGVQLMRGFYSPDGSAKFMTDAKGTYPDLSKFKVYQ